MKHPSAVHRALLTVGAAVLLVLIALISVPGCVLKLTTSQGSGKTGSNTSDTGGEGGGGGAGGSGAAGGAAEITSEDDALSALQNADPAELARLQARSRYTSYALAGLVGTNAGDPAALDDTTLDALIDEFLPTAWDEAQGWLDTLDPATIPLAQVTPKYECEQQTGCAPTESCKFDGYDKSAYCIVTACGDGACPGCPDLFDLSKLIVKSWCSYTCMVDKQIVGIKIALKIALFGHRARCILLEKPVPCEGICGP